MGVCVLIRFRNQTEQLADFSKQSGFLTDSEETRNFLQYHLNMRQNLREGWSTKIDLDRVKDIPFLKKRLSFVRVVFIMIIYQNFIMEQGIVLNVCLSMRLVPFAKAAIMLLT